LNKFETIQKELFSFYQEHGHCYVSSRIDAALFRKVQKNYDLAQALMLVNK
jgi:hypothetical protein